MSTIPLPALDVRQQQQPDPMADVSKLMALRSMMTNQASQQQELQIRGQQVKDQQATTAAMKDWDGKDYGQLAKSVLDNGGSANAATTIQQHGLTVQKTVSDIAAQDAATGSKNLETFIGKHKAIGDTLEGIEQVPDDQIHATAAQKVGELMKAGVLDPQTGQQAMQAIQATPDPAALRQKIDVFAKSSMGAKAAAEQAQTQAVTAKDTADTSLANASAEQKRQESQFYQSMGSGAPGVPSDMLEMSDALRRGAISNPSQWSAYKAQQEARATEPIKVQQAVAEAQATQPLKIQTAEAEGKARQLVQGLGEPVYAMDDQGNKVLTSKTAAIQSGAKTILPVTEKQVSDDTMLINRLGDVRQKISRYEQALTKLGTTITPSNQADIGALLDKGPLKLGAFGTELPLGRLDSILQRENIKALPDDAKQLLVSYYNARESMQGYSRVLSGTGRSNEKGMELNLDALPNPSTADRSYATESLKQFRENLAIVGQGLPKIPGVKSPEEIEAQTNGSSTKSPSANDPLGIR